MRALLLAAALALSGCADALGGSFYGSTPGGFGGEAAGGDVAAAWTQIGSVDFTGFSSAQDLTASGDTTYALESGVTVSVYNSADGSLDVLASGAGLDIVRSASNGPSLAICLEDEGWIASYVDDVPLRVVLKYEIANTNIATTNAAAFAEWSGNDSDATAAGNMKHQIQALYDGSTYDVDGFTWDGGFRAISQAGNAAGMPEYMMLTLNGPRGATGIIGEASSVPVNPSDFTTVDASGHVGATPIAVVGGADPDAFSGTSKHWLRVGGAGSFTDIRILSITFYRFQ